jgi:hypothetical protein
MGRPACDTKNNAVKKHITRFESNCKERRVIFEIYPKKNADIKLLQLNK